MRYGCRVVVTVFLLGFSAFAVRADERIWLNAKISQIPVRLFLDTGAENVFLFRSSAERLGLKLPPRTETSSWNRYWAKDQYNIELLGLNRKTRVAIMEVPSHIPTVDNDGFAGWGDISDRIVRFDALSLHCECITKIPEEVKDRWLKVPLCSTGSSWWKKRQVLALNLGTSETKKQIVIIDTGSASGIGLPEKIWNEWKENHSDAPKTLTLGSMAMRDVLVREQTFAAEFALGPVSLTDVVLEEADPWSSELAGAQHYATVGLGGLKRFDLIVDGNHQVAYIRPKTATAPSFNHNRLGAVFAPADSGSEDLIARVVEGSPAFEAGLRNGDVLARVDGRDVSNWRAKAMPAPPLSHTNFWNYPAGTTVRLQVRRGNETHDVTAVLKELLVR